MDLIQQILSGLSNSTAATNRQLMDVGGVLSAANTNEQRVSDETTAGAGSDILVARSLADNLADITAQKGQKVQQAQAEANLTPTDPNNAYTVGLAELTALNAERRKAYGEVQALGSARLFDNPIEYIMAQLAMPSAAAKATGLDKQAEIVTQDVAARLDLLNKHNSTVTANTVEATRAAALQEADLKTREAQRQLASASAATRSKIAAQQMQIANLADKVHGNNVQLGSIQLQAINTRETMAMRREALEIRMEEKRKERDAELSLEAGLARASALLGYPQSVDFKSFKAMPASPAKRALESIARMGSLGPELAIALPTLIAAGPNFQGMKDGGNAGFAKFTSELNKTASDGVHALMSKPDPVTGKTLKLDQAMDIGLTNLATTMNSAASDPKTATPINSNAWDNKAMPYRAQYKVLIDLATAGKLPNLNNNIVLETAKTVLPQVSPGADNFQGKDETQVIFAIAKAVETGKVNVNAAARDMANFYGTAAAKNRELYKYDLLGLPIQDRYMVGVKAPGFFSDTRLPNDDVMSEAGAKRLLLSIVKDSMGPTYHNFTNRQVGQ